MRQADVHVGQEYALKTDWAKKGSLPLEVARVLVVETNVEHTARRRRDFHAWDEELTNGIRVRVLEFLAGRGDVPEHVRVDHNVALRVGREAVIEGARLLVAPWAEYAERRAVIEHERNERQAAAWEQAEREHALGERLRALGFSTRPHGDVWRAGYVAEADYTERGNRLTVEALERLVTMAERH